MSEQDMSEATSPKTEADTLGERDNDEQHPRKRQRVRLSCLECRRRKLSCDRGFPCERCLKSGTPERCSYETRPGLAPPAKNGLSQAALSNLDSRLSLSVAGSGAGPTAGGSGVGGAGASGGDFLIPPRGPPREYDRIRRLELEVAQLKNLLSKSDGSITLNGGSPQKAETQETIPQTPVGSPSCHPVAQYDAEEEVELRFFRGKEFKTRYYGPHNALMAFSQLSGLSPFMQETAVEWLKPLHEHHKKDHQKRKREREELCGRPDPQLEALVPSREETDTLVEVYLDQFEQVHRIVHVPSFRRQYATYWDPSVPHHASFTALILSMMSISSCLHGNTSGKLVGMVSQSHHMAEQWIRACETWNQRQSQKHRKLIHYQIACMNYLAKRVNTVKKKRFWTGAGALVQDGVSVGLHRDPSHKADNISVYNQEMRRRIWCTLQEFDMQASFDHGLPTLLSALHFDVDAPSNLDDEDFDEDTTELPPSKPITQYTYTSYQHLCRQSLALRLELSRILTGPPDDIDYEQVIRYTNEITQEIDSLPSWDINANGASEAKRKPLLAYTFLHIQLRQYIIPLHQPYLKLRKTNSRYQYSEIIYYNAARDMVLLHDKLAEQGIRTLNFLREDALTLTMNLCSVTLLQPRGSTNMIMVNSEHTVKLMEKCLAMKEDRILRCGNNEPWGYSIMCAAFGLLEAHLGEKTTEAAKAASAERFINLHYKLLAWQDPPSSSAGQQSVRGGGGGGGLYEAPERQKSVTPFPFAASQGSNSGANPADAPPTPWWLPNADPAMQSSLQPMNPDFSLELLGVNLNSLWADYSWEDLLER